jgi:hypothetical protein
MGGCRAALNRVGLRTAVLDNGRAHFSLITDVRSRNPCCELPLQVLRARALRLAPSASQDSSEGSAFALGTGEGDVCLINELHILLRARLLASVAGGQGLARTGAGLDSRHPLQVRPSA